MNELSQKLALEEYQKKNKAGDERIKILRAADELKVLIAELKGYAEVLAETGVVPDDGYEGKLLSNIMKNADAVEEVINGVKSEHGDL